MTGHTKWSDVKRTPGRGMDSPIGSIILLAMAFAVILLFINSAITMLMFNLIHYNIDALHWIPPFGYWDSFIITAVIGWVGFLFKGVGIDIKAKSE